MEDDSFKNVVDYRTHFDPNMPCLYLDSFQLNIDFVLQPKEASNHAVTTADLPRKDKLIGETRDGGKEDERSNVEKRFESAGCESSASKWKTVFTFAETSSVSGCDSHPRSVYWLNAITGAALFGIFVRELIVFGSW